MNVLHKFNRIPLKKIIIWILLIFMLVQLVVFIFRNPLANYLVHQKAQQYGESHQAELHIGKIRFKGLSGVQVDDIFVKAEHKDTLLKVKSAYVRLSFWDMLIFKVNLIDFKLDKTQLSVKRDSLGDNYSNFIANNDQELDSLPKEDFNKGSYAERASNILGILFNLIPSNITINDFTIKADLRDYQLSLYLAKLAVEEHQFSSMVEVTEEKIKHFWTIEGVLNPSEKMIECKWFSADTAKVSIPYLAHKFSTLIAFDTIQFKFVEETTNESLTQLRGNTSVKGLIINNKRISGQDIILNNGKIQYKIDITDHRIALDSCSEFVFNKISFHPYIAYTKKPHQTIELKIHKPWFTAQDFFLSLPKGLFNNLDGIKVSGELAYNLNLLIDFDQLDSLQFDSRMKRRNFRINHYGESNLAKLNESFIYTAFEKGEAVRSLEVGPANPNFRSMLQIPPHLVNVILYSEDLGFFYHNGFSKSAFRSSMVTNLKARRFVRGGSTISMQLVKNVYLTRNKTISRKLEEAILVWLIESNRIASKQRMMEVYLNIIEWGPGIYGANEASMFYFNKDVSQINLAEAIFMASIVPKPKWFRSSFDSQAQLKPYHEHYYQNIANRMLKNGVISQQEFDNLKPSVVILGPAKDLLLKSDTTLL